MANISLERKKELQEPDEFISLANKALAYAKANQQTIINGICIVVAVVLGITGFLYYTQTKEEKASVQLSKDAMAFDKLTRGDKEMKGLTAQNIKEKSDAFDKYYSHTATATLARAKYAGLLFDKGDYDGAQKLYTELLGNIKGDDALKNMALCSVAQCQEAMNKTDLAVATYEKIVSGSNPAKKDEALFHLGMIYEKKGDAAKSKDAFTKISTDYPESIYKAIAKEKISG